MLDLDASLKIALYSLIWGALLLLALARTGNSRLGSIGLPLAFLMSYTISHVGALVHLVDGYDPSNFAYNRGFGYTKSTVAEGLELSFLAMLFTMLGVYIVELRSKLPPVAAGHFPLHQMFSASILSVVFGLAVLIVSTVMARLGVALLGLQAFVSALRNLFVFGACGLILHKHLSAGPNRALALTVAFAVLTPIVVLLTTAILADSVELSVVIVAFFFSLRIGSKVEFKRDVAIFSAIIAACFIFSSAYLQYRDTLRNVVWYGGSVQDAAEATVSAAKQYTLGSSSTDEALALLDVRLNQSIFIGLAIERLNALPDTFENGATLLPALFGWVPRLLWPDKPERGGSDLLAKHTGLVFAQGTTFGAGLIFEFYVNFGYTGVVIGFLLIGMLLGLFDMAGARALRAGDMPGFAECQIAGIALIPSLADLLFVVIGVATALIVGRGLRYLW